MQTQSKMRRKPDYGIDSPGMVAGQFLAGALATGVAIGFPRLRGLPVRELGFFAGAYFFIGALGMVYHSRVGKMALRDKLLDHVSLCGHEMVLDLGCGPGLLLVAAARRLKTGKAIGVDMWISHAISENGPGSALQNAAIEGVADRVEVKEGDVRRLPFEDGSFHVVVSNFVVHEMNSSVDREKMLREILRVLKPGGRLALIDFIFTKECMEVLKRIGAIDVARVRAGGPAYWISTVLMLGTFQLYEVTATKPVLKI